MKRLLLMLSLLLCNLSQAQDLTGQATDADIDIILSELVVKGQLGQRHIDKMSYTFSAEEIKSAAESHALVATLPNLFVNKTTNSLATLNGKSVLILINGVRANDEELKLIPADKVKRVEYYDVPPMRYLNDAEVVVNVLTKPLDTGVSGRLQASVGQFFSNGNASLSFVKGDRKLTLNYGPHFNMKRNARETESGQYRYTIGRENYAYDYASESQSWGVQHSVNVTYGQNQENDYEFQVKATLGTFRDNLDTQKKIRFTRNQQLEQRTGALTDESRTLSPTIDVYYQKMWSRNTLTLNLLGSLFDNEQRTHSFESGAAGFDDRMQLDNQKKSWIGEAVFSHRFQQATLTLGYRGQYSFLSNRLLNSFSTHELQEKINMQQHYFYGEMSGSNGALMYRASLGGNYDRQLGTDGFSHLTFTPVFLLGYSFNEANSLRLSYSASTEMPGIQQLSDARILIMSDFYRTGNRQMENAHLQQWALTYDFFTRRFSLQANLYCDHTSHSLFDNYRPSEGCLLLQTGNAVKDIRRGLGLSVNFAPVSALRLGANMKATQHVFQPMREVATCRYWSFPASFFLSARHKSFSFQVYQMFGGVIPTGLYKMGIEKVSYVNVEYQRKQLTLGLRCFFPFIKDKVSNETIPTSTVYHRNELHMRQKDHAFTFDIAWRFSSGRRTPSIEPAIENSDSDSGLFKVK